MYKLVVLLACLALSHAGMVRRDAPASTPFQDIEKNAAELHKTFTEQLNSIINPKNTEEFNKALKDGSDSVLTQLSSFGTSLQAALVDANGKTKEALEQTRASLERTAEDLRKQHPDVEKQAEDLKAKLQTAVQNAASETQKLAKTISDNFEQANKELGPKLKAAFDDFTKNAQEVQKKLHEATTKE